MAHCFRPSLKWLNNARSSAKASRKGADEETLRALAEQLGIADRIVWLGHLSRAKLEQEFNSVWVQVVPSQWAEPFGNVTTEAMMRGTAVVASAVGAQPEIIGSHQQAGTLVPPGDSEALAAALLPILQRKAIAEQMGAAGHTRAMAEFSETRCVENFLRLYDDLVAQPSITQSQPVMT